MTNYDDIGIAPDDKVVNTKEDLIGNVNPVIAKAMEILNEIENVKY